MGGGLFVGLERSGGAVVFLACERRLPFLMLPPLFCTAELIERGNQRKVTGDSYINKGYSSRSHSLFRMVLGTKVKHKA
jgi:hypothetical protein